MANEGDVPAQGFLSYTRVDNDDFDGVVDELQRQLQGRFRARTGRALRLFVDRDSIGWGDDWRERIRDSVESATFFIPVVTARYFQSEPCREELLAFHQTAQQLGVTELILPIVLSGADRVRADDPREEVQLIERLNYKSIEEAWLDGYQSSTWRRLINGMVQELSAALERAEAALAGREGATAAEAGLLSDLEEEVESQADVSRLIEHLEDLTPSMAEAQVAMNGFVEATTAAFDIPEGLSNSQRQAALIRASKAVKKAAEDFEERSSSYEQDTLQIDAEIRAVLKEIDAIPGEQAAGLASQVRGSFSDFPDLTEGLQAFDQVFPVLQLAAVTNVSLRKAMNPAIRASRAMRNALSAAQSWKTL